MKEIFFQKYYGAVTGGRKVQSHSKFDLSLYTNLNFKAEFEFVNKRYFQK